MRGGEKNAARRQPAEASERERPSQSTGLVLALDAIKLVLHALILLLACAGVPSSLSERLAHWLVEPPA